MYQTCSFLCGGNYVYGRRLTLKCVPHQIVRTTQKDPDRKYLVLRGVALHKRRHSNLKLDMLMIVEMDVLANDSICFLRGSRLVAVNALSLEDGEEIFSHEGDVP